MAKTSNGRGGSKSPPTKQEKKDKKKSTWSLIQSQKSILAQMRERHAREHIPLKVYQEHQTRRVLLEFQEELGIPKKYWDDVYFNFKTGIFEVIPKLSKAATASPPKA